MTTFTEEDHARFLEAERVDAINGIVYGPPPRITTQWASDVKPERIEWLWTDRLPLHDLAVLAGEPGLGKSTTTTELAAQITRGDLPGALHGAPHSVLVATAEDHFESVVWGRLKAAGADSRLVANLVVNDGLLAIPQDVEALALTCRRLREEGRPAALTVVDPISAYLGGVDSHKDASVRAALAPLAKLAQDERVCVLAVAHLNKSNAGQLLSRISGSGAFGAAPRSVLAFARDPDDDDGEQGRRRVIVHAKSNHGQYAPTLAVHIDAVMVEEVGATVSRLVIDGETSVGPEDLRQGGDQSSGQDVRDAIINALAEGPKPSREVKAQVSRECAVSTRTVERAAANMSDDGELVASRAGWPAVARWELPQLRHDQSRQGVATAAVATGNRPQKLAIQAVTSPSSDALGDMSLLDDLASKEGESYEEWSARVDASFRASDHAVGGDDAL